MISPHPEQQKIIEAYKTSRRVLIQKERQIGSTTIFCVIAIEDAQSRKCTIEIVCCNSNMSNHMTKQMKILLEKGSKIGYSCNPSEDTLGGHIYFENGSRIRVSAEKFFIGSRRGEACSIDVVMLDEYEFFSHLKIQDLNNIINEASKFIAASSVKDDKSESIFGVLSATIIDNKNIAYEAIHKMRMFAVK